MAVMTYFGLPGAGKTTVLAYLAYNAIRKRQYENVYTNVPLMIPGVTLIENDDIGRYELANCLLLIDEGTLFADSRAYKSFDKGKMEYFLLHRHRHADIVIFTQQWDALDRKIRCITDRVYYVKKGLLTGKWITSMYRVPYGILFPEGDKKGEIVQGYEKPPFLNRLFARRIYRPKYYKYFDSFLLDPLDPLPADRVPVKALPIEIPVAAAWVVSTSRFMRRFRRRRRRNDHGQNFEVASA